MNKPPQPAVPTVNEEQQALIDTLADFLRQSNNALAMTQAKLSVAQRQNARLTEQLAKAQAQIERLTPKPVEESAPETETPEPPPGD